MNYFCLFPGRRWVLGLALLIGGVVPTWLAAAAPVILSMVPTNMATGVNPSLPVRFTFSAPMNPVLTTAQFVDASAPTTYLATTPAWSAGNTVLSCTPVSPFPGNKMIVWMASGESAVGDALGGDDAGVFTTTSASGNIGCATDVPALSFTVAKAHYYSQTSAGAPTLNSNMPYCLVTCTTIPCPRTATNVSVRVPLTGSVLNLPSTTTIPGHLVLTSCGLTNQAVFEATYPDGDYLYNVQAASSNQQITVNFPSSLTQPAAPRLTNYLAAQSVNPGQPFTLAWDPFSGGTVADYIYVEINGGLFATPGMGSPGALNGTAVTATIPAGTLQPSNQYSGSITFYHQIWTTNATHSPLVYRATVTEFTLKTTGGTPTNHVAITKAGWTGGRFSFEIVSSNNLSLAVDCRTNLSVGTWQNLLNTNTTLPRVPFLDTNPPTGPRRFYRVRGS